MSRPVFDYDKMFDSAVDMATGFTTAASPVTSTNVVDLGTEDGDEKMPPEVMAQITGGDSVSDTGTIQIIVQDSPNGTSGWATILTGKVSLGNAVDLDGNLRYRLPTKHNRYARLQYAIATNNFTAGTLNAGIV